MFVAALITAFLTAFYMGRACQLTFFGGYRRMPIAGARDGRPRAWHGLPHESPPSMTWPLIILGVLSVVGGLVGTPFKNLFADWIHFEHGHHGEFVPWIAMLVDRARGRSASDSGMRLYSGATLGFGILDPLEEARPDLPRS